MPTHRKPPSRRNWIYTAIVVAVAVFAAILGFGGGSKSQPTASKTLTNSSAPSGTTSPTPATTTPSDSTSASTPASTPASASPSAPAPSASATQTAAPTPTQTQTPIPSASSTGLGTSDATLGSLSQRVQQQPTRIRIPALNVNAEIIPAGVDTSGALEVPDNVIQAAWFEAGNAPGQPGTAIIAAHVDYNGQLGLFNQLHTLAKGTEIFVTDSSGTERRFTVTEGKLAPKSDPTTVEELAAASGGAGQPRLALITCGGDLNAAQHSYYDNYVLLADA